MKVVYQRRTKTIEQAKWYLYSYSIILKIRNSKDGSHSWRKVETNSLTRSLLCRQEENSIKKKALMRIKIYRETDSEMQVVS